MTLWIRSQCKEVLMQVEFLHIEEYINTPMCKIYTKIRETKVFLGEYERRERCIEILEQITQERICLPLSNRTSVFYQMPKE